MPCGLGVPRRVLDPERLEEARPQVVEHASCPSPSARSPRACRSPACCRRSACPACARPGSARNSLGRLSSESNGKRSIASACWPVDIVSRSRTRIAFRLSLGSAGASSGNAASTVSSRLSLPSAIARPTAVDVKLLLSEKSTCGSFFAVGRPPALGDHLAVAHDHDAVQGVDLLLGRLDEGEDRRGRDALGLGVGAREGVGLRGVCPRGRSRPKAEGDEDRTSKSRPDVPWPRFYASAGLRAPRTPAGVGRRSERTSAACSTSAPASRSRPPR